LEANDDFTQAQTIDSALVDGRQWVLGQAGSGDSDFYAVSLSGGSQLQLHLCTLPADDLTGATPVIRLYDSSGTLVAESTNGNMVFRAPAGAGEVYYTEVSSSADAGDDYALAVRVHDAEVGVFRPRRELQISDLHRARLPWQVDAPHRASQDLVLDDEPVHPDRVRDKLAEEHGCLVVARDADDLDLLLPREPHLGASDARFRGSDGEVGLELLVDADAEPRAALGRQVDRIASLQGVIGELYATADGEPGDVPELMRERSPITYVDRVSAPMLILGAEHDSRCPLPQILTYVERLKARGQPHELYLFTTGHNSFEIDERIRQVAKMAGFLASTIPGVARLEDMPPFEPYGADRSVVASGTPSA